MMSDGWTLIGRQEDTGLGGIIERLRQLGGFMLVNADTNSVEATERFDLSPRIPRAT